MSETKYQKMGLTPKGNALIAKVQGGSGNIKITKFSAGAGVYEEGEDYTLREGLKDPRQDFAIDSKEVADDNSLILGVTLSNNPAGGSVLQEGYKIREMAFFAQDPDEGEICYSIMVGTDDQMMDYMPAYDGIIPSEIINYFYVKVANADQVTINVAPGDKVGSPEGAYGMRIYNGKQQYLNQEGQWVDIDTDASAMIVNNIENVNEDVPEIEEGDSFGKIIGKLIKLLSNKINISNIVDNCTSDDSDKPLSAKQGKVLMDNKLAKTGDASNTTNIFSQASTRVNLSTGEKISVSLGKIMKWFVDLKEIAFSGKASDLTQDSSNRLVTDTEKSSWNGKVNASNGDIQNTKVGAFTASSASWPIPTAGETVKVVLGKIVKYFTDLNNWRSTVVLIANIVNNCTSTDTNKPLSANQGKVLMDGKAPKNHATNSTTYGGGTASNYGHVKLSDSYTSSGGAASNSVGASSKAVADAYAKLNSDKLAVSTFNSKMAMYLTYPTVSWGKTQDWYKLFIRKQGNVCILGGCIMLPADGAWNPRNIFTFPSGYAPNIIVCVMVSNEKSTVRLMKTIDSNVMTAQYPVAQTSEQEYWLNIVYTVDG